MYNIEYLQTLKYVNCVKYQLPSNTPDISVLESIGGSLSKIGSFFGAITKYCMNPLLLVRDLTIVVAKCSYCICTLGTMWLVIIYVFTDDDKYLKKAKVTVVVYLILQVVGGCMQGVLK